MVSVCLPGDLVLAFLYLTMFNAAGPIMFAACAAELCCCYCAPPPFQEGDDYDVIPDSKFYVSRTAGKDNSSSYHISGKKTTFKDVGTLLRSHGIDLDHNRFLILQVSLISLFCKMHFSFSLYISCV